MGSPTVRQILDDTRRLLATKSASVKGAEITGTAPSSMPGAEHDSPVPGETKKPDAETRDGTMVPTSGLSTAGAGDDSPKTRGHALESDEAAESPEKKPAVTADANAKTAEGTADLANEILTLVRSAQKVAAAPAPAPAPAKAAQAPAAPVKQDPAPAAKTAGGELQMELTTDVMAKVAALLLSTQEGAEMAEAVLEKVAGAQMMRETLDFLAGQSELAEKAAAFAAGEADAMALIQEQIYAAGVADGAQKTAQDMFYKMGQDMADASIGEMMGGAPEAGGEMPPAMAGGEMPPEAGMEGGEGGDISIEDAIQILQQLVDSGELQAEEAETVAQMLMGGEGGAPAEEPAPDAGAPAEEPAPAEGGAPAEEPAPAEEAKAASAQGAQSLLAAIQAVRAGRVK